METIKVTAKLTQEVGAPIARQICEDFAEWLEGQGLAVTANPFHPNAPERVSDNRSYAELARDFIEDYG